MISTTQSSGIVKQEPNALFHKKPKALEVMAERMNVDPTKLLDTLKNTVFKGATNEEMLTLVVVANEYGLNPLLKEMYAFPAKGGGIVPVVGVDGWNKLMNRADNFDGIEFSFEEGQEGKPVSCTATVYLKGRSHPVKITEHYVECVRNTEPWKQMPRRMLRHKALIQACRVGFGFAGIYDEDEAKDQIDESRFDSARPVFQKTPVLEEKKPLAENNLQKDSEITSQSFEKPTVEEVLNTPADGNKTIRINAVCQAQKIEIGDAIAYFKDQQIESFEDVHDRTLESIEKRPSNFASMVRQFRGDK